LIHLHQHGIRGVFANAALQTRQIGYEKIVADQCYPVPQQAGNIPQPGPVILPERIFN
jgi:hypothetical protein